VSGRAVRDLPWGQFRTTVDIEIYRVKCPDCGVKREKVVQLPSKAPFSQRFEEAVGEACESASADPLSMADRHSYLARALRVLTTPGCDGIMGTTDLMEDVLIVSALVRTSGRASLVNAKVLIGCMNRGGHAGVEGEIDDRFTSFTARRLKSMNFDGGKIMYRLDPADERSIKAISDCAQAITEVYREDLYSFLEPMSVQNKKDGSYPTPKATIV
jgi:hypothetical protein